MNFGLRDAILYWASGQSLAGHSLFSLNSIWWIRIGMTLQFLGGLVVVAEIIGANRLRSFGRSLNKFYTLQHFKKSVRKSWNWHRAYLRRFGTNPRRTRRYTRLLIQTPFGIVVTLVNFAWLFSQIPVTWGIFSATMKNPGGIFGFMVGLLFTVVAWIAMAIFFHTIIIVLNVAIFIFPVIGIACDKLLIDPLASIIEHEKIDIFIKAGGAFLVAIGFCIGLLFS